MPTLKQHARLVSDDAHNASLTRIIAFLPALLLVVLSGAGRAHAQDTAHRYITIGTGSPTGAYHAVGTAICNAVNRQSELRIRAGATLVTKCLVAFSGGSVFNIRQVGNGAFTFVIAQSNVAQLALDTDPPDAVASVLGLRSVLALHNEALHVVVRPDSALNDLSDLSGASISAGGVGSGSRQLFLRAADVHGVPEGAFDHVDNMAHDTKVRALCDGRLSAFAVVTAVPSEITLKAASECGAQLLSLNPEAIAQQVASRPSLNASLISKNAYPGMHTAVDTIGVRAGLFTRDVVPDVVVRDVVEAVLSNMDVVREAHPALADLSQEFLSPTRLGVPVHRAAEKAFNTEDVN